MQTLRLVSIFQSENKVNISLVINFLFISQTFLKNSVQKGTRQSSSSISEKNLSFSCKIHRHTFHIYEIKKFLPWQFLFVEHSIVILIKIQVLAINFESRWRWKPVGLLKIFRWVLVSQFQKIVQKTAGQDVLYANPASF